MSYSDVLPHDPPKQLAEDIFVTQGCVKPSAIARFTRNMAIVRHNGELTLINPVRMDEGGKTYTTPGIDHALSEGGELPFAERSSVRYG